MHPVVHQCVHDSPWVPPSSPPHSGLLLEPPAEGRQDAVCGDPAARLRHPAARVPGGRPGPGRQEGGYTCPASQSVSASVCQSVRLSGDVAVSTVLLHAVLPR